MPHKPSWGCSLLSSALTQMQTFFQSKHSARVLAQRLSLCWSILKDLFSCVCSCCLERLRPWVPNYKLTFCYKQRLSAPLRAPFVIGPPQGLFSCTWLPDTVQLTYQLVLWKLKLLFKQVLTIYNFQHDTQNNNHSNNKTKTNMNWQTYGKFVLVHQNKTIDRQGIELGVSKGHRYTNQS